MQKNSASELLQVFNCEICSLKFVQVLNIWRSWFHLFLSKSSVKFLIFNNYIMALNDKKLNNRYICLIWLSLANKITKITYLYYQCPSNFPFSTLNHHPKPVQHKAFTKPSKISIVRTQEQSRKPSFYQPPCTQANFTTEP